MLCVPLGWVVAHVHVSQYRVRPADLSYSSYVWNGALVLGTVLIPFLLLLTVRQAVRYYLRGLGYLIDTFCFSLETGEPVRDLPRSYLWVGRLQLVLAVVIAPYMLICIGLGIFDIELTEPWKASLASTTAANAGIILLLCYLISFKGHLRARLADLSLLTTFSAALLFLHAFTFGFTLYNEIPGYYGGGRPEPVTILYKEDPRTDRFLEEEREDFHSVSGRTEPARLLTETRHGYIFLVKDVFGQEKAMAVQRELVERVRPADSHDWLASGELDTGGLGR